MAFGTFTFGGGYFGQPQGVSTGTAIVRRQTLSITCRGATAKGVDAGTYGGAGLDRSRLRVLWPPEFASRDRIAKSVPAWAQIQPQHLNLKQQPVTAHGGAGAKPTQSHSRSKAGPVCAEGFAPMHIWKRETLYISTWQELSTEDQEALGLLLLLEEDSAPEVRVTASRGRPAPRPQIKNQRPKQN
jgi:hypothetical protein